MERLPGRLAGVAMSDAAIETRLRGISLSPGVALGRACLYSQALACPDSPNFHSETDRLQATLAWMVERKATLAQEADSRLGAPAGEIFQVHRMILVDGTLRDRLFKAIEIHGLTAEGAIEREFNYYQRQLLQADSPYLQERAADITDIQRGLLERLAQVAPALSCKDMAGCALGECRLGNRHIVIAAELTPELTLEVDRHTMGFLVDKGAATSHAAILARGLGLPVVGGISQLCSHIPRDAQILIDADSGEVVVNPSEETLSGYQGTIQASSTTIPVADPIAALQVMANVDRPAAVREALLAKADGIGLSRTEIELLAKGRLLTEAEQTARLQEMIEAMTDKPVYVRLIDLGSDKGAQWLRLPEEPNPALGCRGARLLLARPELLREQARALARCSVQRPIHVVYPMVSGPEQFRRLRASFEDAVADISCGTLFHGPMLEVPAACLQVDELLEEADFGCIGTNDLAQYLTACDRTDASVPEAELLENPALWKLIEHMVRAAEQAGKPLSICGELAGNPNYTRRIIDAGIKAVSTNPRRIAPVRLAARHGAKPSRRGRPASSARPGPAGRTWV